jgi:hypothetical protein
MAVGCGFFAIAEPYVPLPAVPMTPLRPTVEELNKAKEREATALREKEKADAEIARLQKELAKKPKEANPPPAPTASADVAPILVAHFTAAATAALDWVNKIFTKLKEFSLLVYGLIALFLGFIVFIYFWLTRYRIIDGEIIDGRYQILANGAEVKDLQTNLIWQRCEVGKTWDGNTCIGADKKFTFDDAQKQAGNGWRVPSIDELKTLLTKEKVNDRFIHPKVFPNTNSYVWSGSPDANNASYAWFVSFYYGYSGYDNRSYNYGVRLVRGGQ